MELSVVLVNHNGAGRPAALARRARPQHSRREVEGIVVDSGSADGSWQDVTELWDRARAIRFEENIGFCAGCNRGAEAAAGGCFVAFVNFDSRGRGGLGRAAAGRCSRTRRSRSRPGCSLRADGETLEAAGLEIAPNTAAYGRLEGVPRDGAAGGADRGEAASGALMMVRRAEFLALGGFYEPIFMYGEEADYCLRVRGKDRPRPASAIRHE